MRIQYNPQSAFASTLAGSITLVEFFRWPLERRKAFVRDQLGNSPRFIRDSLLRAT